MKCPKNELEKLWWNQEAQYSHKAYLCTRVDQNSSVEITPQEQGKKYIGFLVYHLSLFCNML